MGQMCESFCSFTSKEALMRFLRRLLYYLKHWFRGTNPEEQPPGYPRYSIDFDPDVHDRDIINIEAILYMEANPDLWDV
jgi:hypothetical protein